MNFSETPDLTITHNVPREDYLYLDFFQGDERVAHVLFPIENKKSAYFANDKIKYEHKDRRFYFFDDFTVKIKATERNFSWLFSPFWTAEKMKVHFTEFENFPRGIKEFDQRNINSGEVWESPFWIEEGDKVTLRGGDGDVFYISTDGKNWSGHIKKSGFLYVKTEKPAVLKSVYIRHKRNKQFSLSPEEKVSYRVEKGDCYEIKSSSGRYFINGTLTNSGRTRKCFYSDQELVFKGSIKKTNISLQARLRRGNNIWK